MGRRAIVYPSEAEPLQAQSTVTPHQELDALMDRYEAPIYRFLAVMLGHREMAQDCTQDVFLRAYDQLRRHKPVTSSWLYTVARHRAMDEFRRRRRERSRED